LKHVLPLIPSPMKRPSFFLLLYLPMLWMACTEFIAPNLSDWKVELIYPGDSLALKQRQLNFRWQELPEASAYQFQLASPDFERALTWLDTLLEASQLRLALPEGHYQWRVRGLQESSETAFQLRSFLLDQRPPDLPWATYPLDGDSLRSGQDPFHLRWQSHDALSGVSDSLYLYRWEGGIPRGRWGFWFEVGEKKQFDLSEWLGPDPEKGTEYRWEIKSFDAVGNSSCSRLFSFWVL
jgi:hypothetical protein